MTVPRFRSGTVLLSKYRLERFLGRGGFAEVYLARHRFLKVPRALKIVVRDEYRVDDSRLQRILERFRREARLGAQLGPSPGLVHVYDFEEDPASGVCILVMEYMPGGSLKERLRHASRGLPIKVVLTIARDAAQGLHVLHKRGLVHRDIKPSNLLFDAQGRVRIADLGIVQTSNRALHTDRPARRPHPGTPMYMSPEQECNPAPLTPASDIYSLGIVLFEALTLQNPKTLPPGTRVRDVRPDVPRWLDDLLCQMLAPEPQARPQDGGELLRLFKAPGEPSPVAGLHAVPSSSIPVDETWDPGVEERDNVTGPSPGSESPLALSSALLSPQPSEPDSTARTFQTYSEAGPSSGSKSPQSPTQVLEALGPVRTLAVMGPWLAAGSPEGVVLWNPVRGRRFPLYGHGGSVTALALRPSAGGFPLVLSGGDDGRLLFWHYPYLRPARALGPARGGIRDVAFVSQASGRFVSVDARGYLYQWVLERVEPLGYDRVVEGESVGVAWLDETHLVLAEARGNLSLWEVTPQGFRRLRRWSYPALWNTFTLQGGRAFLGAETGHLWCIDVFSGQVQGQWKGHEDGVAFFQEHHGRLISAGWDARLRVWDRKGQLVQEVLLPVPVLAAALVGEGIWVGSPKGNLLFFPL